MIKPAFLYFVVAQMPSNAFSRFAQSEEASLHTGETINTYQTIRPPYILKYTFDKIFAFSALLFFAPFMILAAIMIYAQDRGPVFFVHTRIGRNGQRFGCLKFRTMMTDADARLEKLLATDPHARVEWDTCQKLRNDPRVSRIGTLLRKTSFDELPQFFNVLAGDMSVVGPRPIVDAEAKHYGGDFHYYTSVRPGITGLWQVSGRSDTSYRQRVRLDVEYVTNLSFLNDIKIILQTVYVVLLRRGAY